MQLYQETLSEIDSETTSEVQEWVTRDQYCEIMKSDKVGNAVCDEKGKSMRTSRPHPDVPWMEDARQYLVPLLNDFIWICRNVHL